MIEPLSHDLDGVAAVVAAIAGAVGIYVRRFRALRLVADAWLAGVVGVGVLALVLVAVVPDALQYSRSNVGGTGCLAASFSSRFLRC